MISLHDLKIFMTVDQVGGVRNAAENLHITQSAVSQAIRRLEGATNLTLLDRDGYRVKPSVQGTIVLRRAVPLLQQMNEFEAFVDALASGVEEQVNIAVQGSVPMQCWLHLIDKVAGLFPDTTMQIQNQENYMARDLLLAGSVDLGVIASNVLKSYDSVLEQNKLEFQPLGQMTFVNVASLALVAEGLARLKTMPQIVISHFKEKEQPSLGVVPGLRYWCVSNHLMKYQLIKRGLGWGNVPKILVENDINNGSVVNIEVHGLPMEIESPIGLYRRANEFHGPVCEAIWSAARGASRS